MYSAQPNGADSATINPAALASDLANSGARGLKRERSPDTYHQGQGPVGQSGDGDQPRKRGKPMKPTKTETPIQPPVIPPMAQVLPPHTPQGQNASLPAGQAQYAPPPHASPPPKATPTKSTLKALPTVRDHTTDQLGPGGDEYLPREIDDAGEKKVMPNGTLCGNRQYRCRTFLVPNRGDKLFMLATECARVLSYRDSYLLFNKNRSLFKIIANQVEKDDLVAQEILPFSYRSRQIAIVTARSMFRQFGSRVIVDGRRVRDDYWEQKARKQGFTEADLAGEKRPGAGKARDAAAAEASHNASLLGGPHGEIVYSNSPAQFAGAPQPQLVQPGMIGATPGATTRMPVITLGPEYNDTRSRDYSNILKTGPRQEINAPPYQDSTRPTPMGELHAQAHHAAEFNRTVNQQREIRGDYLQTMWRRPHEQPVPTTLAQPGATTEASIPTSRPAPSTHSTAGTLQQPSMVPAQSPQMMMTAAPYSQPISAQNPIQSTMRGMTQLPSLQAPQHSLPATQDTRGQQFYREGSTATMPQPQGYSYPQTQQMWPQQSPQYSYSHPSQAPQASPHQQQQAQQPQQSTSASQLRHSSTGSQVQSSSGMAYSGMPGMSQAYPSQAQSLPYDQTPRQYMHPQQSSPAVTQAWSGQQQAPTQWWAGQQQ